MSNIFWFWFWSHASDTVGSKDIRNLWHEARHACVTPRGALASRDVMPSSFYSTAPKSCSHWSSLQLGATLEHTKILWTLFPTKMMAFCRMGPSNRSSNKFRIFCCNSRTPLGGSGLCGQSRMACRTAINLARQKEHSSSTSTLDSGS